MYTFNRIELSYMSDYKDIIFSPSSGGVIELRLGTRLKLKHTTMSYGIKVIAGTEFIIAYIKEDNTDRIYKYVIGLACDENYTGYKYLGQLTPKDMPRGMIVHEEIICNRFNICKRFNRSTASTTYVIDHDFVFKGQNLRDTHCRILAYLKDEPFVECERHVKGYSCDGLGKAGHCVVVPIRYLKEAKYDERDGEVIQAIGEL